MIVSGLLFFPADWPRRLVRKWIGAQRVVERGSVREATERRLHPWGHVALACYVVVQLYLPLRPYLQSESSAWTCRGFNWSWRVMLVEKSGYAEFRAFDPATGQRWRIGATDYLTPRQAQFMAQAPAMIRALARHITADFRARGYDRIQVFADAYAVERPSQPALGRSDRESCRPNTSHLGGCPAARIVAAPAPTNHWPWSFQLF